MLQIQSQHHCMCFISKTIKLQCCCQYQIWTSCCIEDSQHLTPANAIVFGGKNQSLIWNCLNMSIQHSCFLISNIFFETSEMFLSGKSSHKIQTKYCQVSRDKKKWGAKRCDYGWLVFGFVFFCYCLVLVVFYGNLSLEARWKRNALSLIL